MNLYLFSDLISLNILYTMLVGCSYNNIQHCDLKLSFESYEGIAVPNRALHKDFEKVS